MRFLRPRDDGGLTLVELLVAMMLFAIIGTLTLTAFINTQHDYRVAGDQAQGLSDVKVAAERLARDIRDARAVVCDGAASDPTCMRHLQLWIDYNSDYVQESDEIVTWQLVPETAGAGVCGPTGHCELQRVVGGTTAVEARTIVTNVAFTYDVPPTTSFAPPIGQPHTTLVNVDMTYNAMTNGGNQPKQVSFSGRLRNVS